jgi:hypothetical protein
MTQAPFDADRRWRYPNSIAYTFSFTNVAPRSMGPGASSRASTLASNVIFAPAYAAATSSGVTVTAGRPARRSAA